MEIPEREIWREVFKKLMEQAKPGDAWKLRMDQKLELHQVPPGWKRSLQKRVCARFTCSRCHHRWTSHQAVILFHLHWERSVRQGRVKMRFFYQQCHECGSSEYEEPQFTEETILNVLGQLVFTIRKKCYREQVEDWDLHEVVCQSGGGPHKENYCEACQLGIHKGHSETSQGGVYYEKTSPWELQYTRQYKWPRVTVHRETTLPRIFQNRMLSEAIGERVNSPESPLTPFPQPCGNVKCCISCVLIVVIIIVITAVIGFLKNWW